MSRIYSLAKVEYKVLIGAFLKAIAREFEVINICLNALASEITNF